MQRIRKAFAKTLCSLVPNNSSVLDIGTGPGDLLYIALEKPKELVTIDADKRYNTTYCINLEKEDLPFEKNRFDVVLAIDFIEHIGPKERGFELIEQMKEELPDMPYVFISSVAQKGLVKLKDILWKAINN